MTTTAQLLQLYLDAEAKILAGQSYRYGDRLLTMADLEQVRKERARLQNLLALETSAVTGGRSRFAQADFSGRGDGCGFSRRCD